MEQAIKIYETSGIEKAESFLCQSFNGDYFSLHSHRMLALWAWKDTPRSRLLDLAYIDHKAGRYHASIPVVLAQIDGLAFDTSKESFFSKKSPLVIENSVAGHETGLKQLSNMANKYRDKTHSKSSRFPLQEWDPSWERFSLRQ